MRSVEPERLIALAEDLIERREAFEQSATSPPKATRPRPVRPGGPARAASSITST